MNNENNQPQNEQQDQLAEELKMQSEVEASEQAPIEEMNELDAMKKSLRITIFCMRASLFFIRPPWLQEYCSVTVF